MHESRGIESGSIAIESGARASGSVSTSARGRSGRVEGCKDSGKGKSVSSGRGREAQHAG